MTTGTEKNNLETIRIALAGFGTVGKGVVRLLSQERTRYQQNLGLDFKLVSILDRSYEQKDTSWLEGNVPFTNSLKEFLEIPADVRVELIGGTNPADQIIRTGLCSQKSVVTANKLLMARLGEEYLDLAKQNNAYLGFEASVAGGIPVVRVLRRSLLSDRINRLRGILNGTCNFILSEMSHHGRDYQDALSQAQSLGYAEIDPSLDVSGGDTADKLAILSTIAFQQGVRPNQIPTRGITGVRPIDFIYSRRLGATIKLLGVAVQSNNFLSLRVSPFLVKNSLPLANISSVLNAVEINGNTLGSVVLSGEGAGANPTAVSVVSDILNAAFWKKNTTKSAATPDQETYLHDKKGSACQGSNLSISEQHELHPFYLRFVVKDEPGIISTLSSVLAQMKINIDSILQENWSDSLNLPFIITVEATPFARIQEAINQMAKLDFNCIPPYALPILAE